MITFRIGGIDHTAALQEGTLVIRHYGALRSTFRATLFFRKIPSQIPKAGQEILVSEDGALLWGGILVETEQVCHSTQSCSITLRGQGYEQILQRYCLPGIVLSHQTPSQAVQYLFQNYLNPADNLILGEVEPGISQTFPYTFFPAKASSVLDRLAKENGFVWWVDKNKTFYMKSKIPQWSQTLSIDLTQTEPNRINDLQTFVYRESTADYKNIQRIYNRANGVEGAYLHVDRLREMGQRYGGGEYGGAAANSAVTHQDEAKAVGGQMMESSPGLGEIEFTTDLSGFAPGQVLGVTAPVCGMETKRYFCITEIRAVYFFDRFRYTVTAKQTDSGPLATTCWEAILADGATN